MPETREPFTIRLGASGITLLTFCLLLAIWQIWVGGRTAPHANPVFVDVGANHYQSFSKSFYLESKLGWSGLAIEPQREFGPESAQYRPRTKFLPFFISDSGLFRRARIRRRRQVRVGGFREPVFRPSRDDTAVAISTT